MNRSTQSGCPGAIGCTRKARLSASFLRLTLALLLAGAWALDNVAAAPRVSTADVRTFRLPDDTPIPVEDQDVVGTATLWRSDNGVRFEITTTQLDAGHAYTVWWVIFNNPAACGEDGCSGADLGNPEVEGSVLFATGRVANAQGRAVFRAFLPVGFIHLNSPPEKPSRHLLGPGLQNPLQAEIHVVIRSHGPASDDPALRIQQISTVDGLCEQNVCFDAQALVFPAPRQEPAEVTLNVQPAVLLSWPQSTTPFQVEAAEQIEGEFHPVDGLIMAVDGEQQLAVVASAQARFFRLKKLEGAR